MLKLGKSKPWKEIMEMMTGSPNMDTSAFREYFAPLEKWLIKHNKEKNNQVQCSVNLNTKCPDFR
jgi:peptidyl-dipeptidase A